MEEYECIHCEGISQILMLKNTEKATEPTIEFCPFCGMSNEYPKEIKAKIGKNKRLEKETISIIQGDCYAFQ